MSAHRSQLPRELAPHLLSEATWEPDVDDRAEIRCQGCCYGAVVAQVPTRCPMCGGTTWREQTPAALGGRS